MSVAEQGLIFAYLQGDWRQWLHAHLDAKILISLPAVAFFSESRRHFAGTAPSGPPANWLADLGPEFEWMEWAKLDRFGVPNEDFVMDCVETLSRLHKARSMVPSDDNADPLKAAMERLKILKKAEES